MRLFKLDNVKGELREVTGEPYPGVDSEGDRVYDNTHYTKRGDALERLRACASAWVSMAGRGVREAELALERARVDAGEAAKAFGRAQAEIE